MSNIYHQDKRYIYAQMYNGSRAQPPEYWRLLIAKQHTWRAVI